MTRGTPRQADGDGGFSLVEVLVAVALLGMAAAATLPAVWGNVRTSALQRDSAAARRWVVSAGELAESAAVPRASCPDDAIAEVYETSIRDASSASVPEGWAADDLTVTEVLFWNGTTFGPTCYEPAPQNLMLQLLRLRVASPDGRVAETLDVIKGA